MRQAERLTDIGLRRVQAAELSVAVEDAKTGANGGLAVEYLGSPRDTDPRLEVVRVRRIESCAGRTVLQPASEGIEYPPDVILFIVHAVVFVAQPGVQRKVRADFEFVQDISKIGVLARLGLDSGAV